MTQDNAIAYIFGYIIAFLIGVFTTRAIFSIPTFLRIQRAKLQVLTEIALQQGVKADIIRSIFLQNGVGAREKTTQEIKDEKATENKVS
ncbi:MAG: hypothetical protein M3O71_14535 [Bacteroidota bacterium]|nr:hypothetical protein [Bacteroidota bacterium]